MFKIVMLFIVIIVLVVVLAPGVDAFLTTYYQDQAEAINQETEAELQYLREIQQQTQGSPDDEQAVWTREHQNKLEQAGVGTVIVVSILTACTFFTVFWYTWTEFTRYYRRLAKQNDELAAQVKTKRAHVERLRKDVEARRSDPRHSSSDSNRRRRAG